MTTATTHEIPVD